MTSILRTIALGGAALALAATPAFAVTVANQSDKSQEITVDLGATEPKTTIEAGKSAKLECPEGCEIRAVGLNSYGIGATSGEKLVIKDGMLQHADASKEASAGSKDKKTMTD